MRKRQGTSCRLIAAVIVTLGIVMSIAPAWAQSAPAMTSLLSLSGARVSALAGDRLVISMDVDGDLPGLLTLTLRRDVSGTGVTGGEWALVVSTRQASVAVAEGAGDPGAWPAMRAGTLAGKIGGGTVRLHGDGSVAEIAGVVLKLVSGSLAFEHARSGHGTANAFDLHDIGASSGTLELTF